MAFNIKKIDLNDSIISSKDANRKILKTSNSFVGNGSQIGLLKVDEINNITNNNTNNIYIPRFENSPFQTDDVIGDKGADSQIKPEDDENKAKIDNNRQNGFNQISKEIIELPNRKGQQCKTQLAPTSINNGNINSVNDIGYSKSRKHMRNKTFGTTIHFNKLDTLSKFRVPTNENDSGDDDDLYKFYKLQMKKRKKIKKNNSLFKVFASKKLVQKIKELIKTRKNKTANDIDQGKPFILNEYDTSSPKKKAISVPLLVFPNNTSQLNSNNNSNTNILNNNCSDNTNNNINLNNETVTLKAPSRQYTIINETIQPPHTPGKSVKIEAKKAPSFSFIDSLRIIDELDNDNNIDNDTKIHLKDINNNTNHPNNIGSVGDGLIPNNSFDLSTNKRVEMNYSRSRTMKKKETKLNKLNTVYDLLFKQKDGKYKLGSKFNIASNVKNTDVLLTDINFADDNNNEDDEDQRNLLKKEELLPKNLSNSITNNNIDPKRMKIDHLDNLRSETTIENGTHKVFESVLAYFNDFFQAIVSILSCCIYVLTTYHDEKDHGPYAVFLESIEFSIAAIFAIDYAHHFHHAKGKCKFIFSINSILDIAIISSTFIAKFLHIPSLGYLHTLSIFRVLRILKIYRLFKEPKTGEKINLNLNNSNFSLNRQVGIFICSLFVLLFVAAGVSYEANKLLHGNNYSMIIKEEDEWVTTEEQEKYTFMTALFLICQQLFLLNFGDITPITASSRMIICLFIGFGAILVIDQFVKLIEILKDTSPWDFEYKEKDHNIILGEFNEYTIWKYLTQIYLEEKDYDEKRTLMIQQGPPSFSLLNVLEGLQLNNNVKYMDTSIYHENTVSKAMLSKASSIVIFTDQFSRNPNKSDENTILTLKLIQDYAPLAKKMVQLIRPEALSEANIIMNHVPWSYNICTTTIKAALMSESIFIKGILTLFGNLFTVYSKESKVEIGKTWLYEYNKSFQQEMFTVDFSKDLIGLKFNEVAIKIYETRDPKLKTQGLLLIGIKRTRMDEHHKIDILINPVNYIIQPKDKGIVIADDHTQAKLLTRYNEKKYAKQEENDSFSSGIIVKINQSQKVKRNILINNIEECYLNKTVTDYKDIKTNIYVDLWVDNILDDLYNHIIIIGYTEIYEQSIINIRKRTKQPIVILADNKPDYTWEIITSKFSNILYTRGNMMNMEHLEKIKLKKAYHVLIFRTRSNIKSNNEANSLLFANLLDEFYNIPYTIELADQESIRYLKDNSISSHQDLRFQKWPRYVCGDVFFSCSIDSLMAMLHQNTTILEVFQHLYDNHKFHFIKDKDIGGRGIYDSRSCQIPQHDIIENKQLQLLEIPKEIEGATYSTIVNAFLSLENPKLPIALYTSRYCSSKEQQNNQIDTPILITNPLPTTIVMKGDKIIVFAEHYEHIQNLKDISERQQSLDSKTDNNNQNIKLNSPLAAGLASPYDEMELSNLYNIQIKKNHNLANNGVPDQLNVLDKNIEDNDNTIEGLELKYKSLIKRLCIKKKIDKQLYEKKIIIDGLKNNINEIIVTLRSKDKDSNRE